MKISLTGAWQCKATDEEHYLQAAVPGCQYLDLLAAGIIEDPFVGTNEQKVQWIHDKDFEYVKTFALSAADLLADGIDLVCMQLDTIAEVRLNGHLLGVADNCHRAHVYAVKEVLHEGDNRLHILFRSPKRYVEERLAAIPAPINANGQHGIVHIRKPQCHFGWDWGPVLTPVGISGDIYLEAYSGARMGELSVRTSPLDGAYRICVHARHADRITLTYPDGRVFAAEGDHAEFLVQDPMLWWTAELSGGVEQPLYTVLATCGEGVYAQHRSRRVGLRTLTLRRDADAYGRNFQFVLNGVPIFAKGANYIPPDCFITRFGAEQLTALLDAVQFANMNMIRVWGGGYYADDALLDACDERGILVWQDCMFACQAYPFFDEAFLHNVLQEIDYNVARISTHPSLALWCGNNEIEDMHLAWAAMRRYVEWTERFFYHILPERIAALDDVTPYIPGSPMGVAHNRGMGSDYVGDTHLWSVWHGLRPMTYYRQRMTRFCSEFGFESLPSYRLLTTYATPRDYALDSAVMRAHQKCAGGNDKMLYYIASRFHLSPDVRQLIYLSQVTQQTCIADATEHWRRHKGRCNGALYWQLNDCWPVCSWSGLDYGGQYKALQYAARHFNAPVSVSLEDGDDKVEVYLLNDLTTAQAVEVEWFVFDFDAAPTHTTRLSVAAAPLANVHVATIPLDGLDARRQGVAVRLMQDGRCVMQKTVLLLPERRLLLPAAPIAVQEMVEDGRRRILLHSDVYQRLVMLSNDQAAPFSDNFFDLLPGEDKVIYQDAPLGTPTEVMSVAVLDRACPLRDVWARVKVFLSPRNLANAMYHGRKPKGPLEDDVAE